MEKTESNRFKCVTGHIFQHFQRVTDQSIVYSGLFMATFGAKQQLLQHFAVTLRVTQFPDYSSRTDSKSSRFGWPRYVPFGALA